ncbi:MAG: radical SAM protein [Spirochaetes bacterium]|nr:radical SAM protein [Spirochaetota bacterium]
MRLYSPCKLCPRNCGVDRLAGETGFCGETAVLRIGAAVIHRGEEPPLVGTGGSGTIFISGCNLGCAFCQNYQISQGENGKKSFGTAVTAEEFTKICAALRDKGAENINIVTGSHAIPSIVEGLAAAKSAGVQIPVLWNSSGYENTGTLELLRGYVDIYLPDLKTLDSKIADKFFNAPDYPQTASSAILKMLEMTEAKEKVIIRHLILPGFIESSRTVLRWFAENAAGRAQLSLMTQYTPIPNRKRPMPNRFLTEDEYETVLGWLEEFGIEDGFCQELVTGSEWLPDFKKQNPFLSELSVPVWHFTSRT